MANWTCSTCSQENPLRRQTCRECGRLLTETAAVQAGKTHVAPAARLAPDAAAQPGPAEGERRLVTAVFADLSGYTTLAERLDPEELVDVVDPLISALTDIVGRFEGHVDKFAGDAVLCLFGAPVAHEDDPERALLAALEMQRELARLVRELPPEDRDLTLHIGVNTGHGVARVIGGEARVEYSVAGDVINVAQRLQSQAPSGEVYVGDLTYELARARFDFEPLGELSLKGKAEPVIAWRLIGERSPPGSLRASSPSRAAPFIGRRAELTAADLALDALVDGSGRLLIVTGEPGVGKSRFTQEVRERAERRGLRWLEARCPSYGAGVPYSPYAGLLRNAAGITRDTPAESARSRLAALSGPDSHRWTPYFSRLLGVPPPAGAGDTEKLEPEAFRRYLHEAVGSWLQAQAHDRGLVLAIEDLHWADASSLALTRELAGLCGSTSFLLYVTARSDQTAPREAVADAAGDTTVQVIALEAFGQADTTALIEGILGEPPHAGLMRVIGERASGNPFFIEEVVQSLRESGTLVQERGKWQLAGGHDTAPLPATVEEVVAGRMDLLTPPAAELLQTASVIGRRVRMPILNEVRGGRPPKSVIAELVEAGFLEPGDDRGKETLVFHHALAQEVAYQRILKRRRRELHRLVAEVAERLYGDGDDVIDVLARHAYLGEIGAEAIGFLRKAGERARSLFANEEAILHFTRAVELAQREGVSADALTALLLDLADLHELRGNYDEALRAYTQARETPADFRAWRGTASTLRKQGRYSEALDLLDVVLASSELRKSAAKVFWLERSWTLSATGRFPEALDAARKGLGLTRSAHDKVAGQLLLQVARAETEMGQTLDAIAHAKQAETIFEDLDQARELSTTMRITGRAYQLQGDLDRAADSLRRGLAMAERIGSIEEVGGSLINLGLVERERGAVEAAIDCDRRAISEFERIGHAAGRTIGYGNLADGLMRLGRLDEALEQCGLALEMARSIGHQAAVADVTRTLASIRLRQGRFLEAASVAEEAAGLFAALGAAPHAVECLELAAEAFSTAGKEAQAREMLAQARSIAVS